MNDLIHLDIPTEKITPVLNNVDINGLKLRPADFDVCGSDAWPVQSVDSLPGNRIVFKEGISLIRQNLSFGS